MPFNLSGGGARKRVVIIPRRGGLWVWICLELVWGLIGVRSALARVVPVPFAGEYVSTVWGVEDGLPENSCSGVVAAEDGSLWLGTFRGLARYNGGTIARYAPPGMPELANLGIISLHRERSGRFWFSTHSGLMSLEGGRWRRWEAEDGWRREGDYVRSYAGRPGHPPVLTRFGGQVYRLVGDRFELLPPLPGSVGGSWAALDAEGGIHVVRGTNAYWLEKGVWQPLVLPAGISGALCGALQSADGSALVVGPGTVLRYRQGRLVGRTELSSPVSVFWQGMEDSEGSLWLPGVIANLYRVRPDGSVRRLRRVDGLAGEGPTRAVFEDSAGGIWVGSGVGGVARLSRARFHHAGEQERFPDAVSQTLVAEPDGSVLVGLYAQGYRVFDGTRLQPAAGGMEEEIGTRIRTLLRTRDGRLWGGVAGKGLRYWDGLAWHSTATEVFPPDSTLSTLFEDSSGRLWAGSDAAVAVLDRDRIQRVTIPGRGERASAVFFAERAGTVAMAWGGRLFLPGERDGWAREWVQLGSNVRVTGLAVDAAGIVWVGSNGQGLYGTDGKEVRHLGLSEGLPSDVVVSLIVDAGDALWFGCGRQAVRGEARRLWQDGRAAGGAPGELGLKILGESDGLRGLDFPLGTQPTVARDPRGRLWFAQVRGLACVDPAGIQFHEVPPPVLIESIRFVPPGGRHPVDAPQAEDGLARLPAGTRQVGIRYTAMDYAAPERHRFRVRLDADAEGWQEMGGDREVVFFEMPPGRHQVQVGACGADGVWNHEGASLDFEVEPFLWQATWFRLAVAAGLLALAGGVGHTVARRRSRQLEIQDALRRLARALTAALPVNSLGAEVAQTSRALFGHDAFLLILLGPRRGIRAVAHAEGLGDLGEGRVPGDVPEGRVGFPAELGSLLEGRAVMLNCPGDAGDGVLAELRARGLAGERVSSLLFAPIRWECQTLGVVSVQSHRSGRYQQADLDQLQTLAAHCAAAIARTEEEEQRRANEERLRLAMETGRMGSWELDAATRRLTASREAEAVYGREPGSMEGAAEILWEGVPEPEASELRRRLSAVCSGAATGLEMVHALRGPGGERWLEVKGRVHDTRGGARARRIIGLSTDITARRHAEQARERLEEQLRQSQKQEAIGTLAGGIAHDFNNLLGAILGNVETARMDLEQGHPACESLEEIRASGVRARDLVRRILAFSRPGEHQLKVVRLPPLLEEVARLLRATIPAGVSIVTQLADEAPAVMVDASQIHQVLVNLGTNAWHALDGKPGRIQLILRPVEAGGPPRGEVPDLTPGRYACLEVVDDGHGIPPEIVGRIFDPFFTTKPPGKGTGLGLSVALAIVRAHGGVMGVDSQPGRGSTFRVFLPAADPVDVVESPGPVQVSTPPVGGQQVLFVDDEESLVRLARRMLERAGYQVTALSDVRAALGLYEQDPQRWSAVITDQSMPGLSGIEFAGELLKHRPDLPVLLCSGNLSESDLDLARVVGVRASLLKPYSVDDLRAAVGRVARAARPGPRRCVRGASLATGAG